MRGLKELEYVLDDRETRVRFTTALGSPEVVVEILPPYKEGNAPGVFFQLRLSHEALDTVRQYLAGPVMRAFKADDIAERSQQLVPFDMGPARVQLACSPNDADNLCRHIREVSAYARSIALAGSVA